MLSKFVAWLVTAAAFFFVFRQPARFLELGPLITAAAIGLWLLFVAVREGVAEGIKRSGLINAQKADSGMPTREPAEPGVVKQNGPT
jgi:hypothetical protein